MANSGHSGIEPSTKNFDKYNLLKKLFYAGPVHITDIVTVVGVNRSTAETMVNNLSHELPIWEPGKGVFKILEEKDFEEV